MAVLVTSTFKDVPQSDYDAMIDGMRPRFLAAPGFVAHIAVIQDGGFKVTEIWETGEDARAWLRDVIVPAMENSGGTAPDVVVEPIHTTILQDSTR